MSELALDLYNALSEIVKLRARIAELEAEVTKGHELQDSYCDRIAELELLIEKLVDEGCVIAERFSAHGGSEADLEGWENAIDEYKAVVPEVQE